ncbi:MAG: TVP38/TMEM64 family protein [Nitrospira sp.]|nr:TVP38/TMEM64 family protein [Nitrospira sp.]
MPVEKEVTSPSAPVSTSITGKVLLAGLFLVAISAFYLFDLKTYLSLDLLKANRDRLLAFTEKHYVTAVVLFILTYIAQTAFSLPGATLMTLTGGFLFDSVPAALYVNIGATIGATLAFLSARYLLRDWVERRFGHRLGAFQEGFARNAFTYLLTLRLIPLFPFFLVNLLSGLTRVSALTYVAATALGIIPGSLVYTFAGRQLGTINSLGELASPRLLLAFTALGLLFLMPIAYKQLIQTSPGRRRDT